MMSSLAHAATTEQLVEHDAFANTILLDLGLQLEQRLL
jgi:hypothetical protein